MYVCVSEDQPLCVCLHPQDCGGSVSVKGKVCVCVTYVRVKWKSVCACVCMYQNVCMSSGLYSCVSCAQESEVVHIVHLTGSKIT